MTTYTCPEGHSSTSSDYCDVCGAPIGGASAAGASAAGASAAGGGPAGGGVGAVPPPMPGGSRSSLDLGAPSPPVGARECPHCGFSNLPGALFCEDCGYDFTTGQLPAPAAGFDGGPPAPGDPTAAAGPGPLAPPAPLLPAGAPPASPPGTAEWVVEVWVDPDWYAAQDVDDPMPSAGMPVEVPLAERSVLVGRTSTSRNIHPQVDLSADNGVSRRHAQLTTDGQRWFVEDLQSSNGTYVGNSGDPLPTSPIPAGQRVELDDDDRVYLGAWTRLVVRRATPAAAPLSAPSASTSTGASTGP